MAEIIDELVGQPPPEDDAICWCGKPATVPVRWPGCHYCGGDDCGDTPSIDWICEECAKS